MFKNYIFSFLRKKVKNYLKWSCEKHVFFIAFYKEVSCLVQYMSVYSVICDFLVIHPKLLSRGHN